MRLSLHFLPTFCLVARLNNLRKAAESLHLTNSAVSQQIQQLEQELGLKLFDRPGRGIRLNAAGQSFLAAVEPALAAIEQGALRAKEQNEREAQLLRVSVLPSLAQRWLLPRMRLWHGEHPHITLDLHASQQVVDLHQGEFHAGIRQGDGQWRGLISKPLFESPWVAVGSARAASRLRGLALEDWLNEPLLGNTERWNEWFASQHLHSTVRPVASFNDAGLMLQAAEQDLGIALTREVLAADALASGSLVRLSSVSLHKDDCGPVYWLTFRPQLEQWPPLVAFYNWLVSPATAAAPPSLT